MGEIAHLYPRNITNTTCLASSRMNYLVILSGA
jgi:hypothetical protein